MAKTAWPDTAALTARLTGLGVATVPTGVVLADVLEAAVERAEELSGRQPFLTEASDSTVYFTPTSSAFMSLGTLYTSVTSVSVDGAAAVLGTDYYLEPRTAPHRWVRWSGQSSGLPQSVTVVGKRGTSIPTEVFNAVLDWAAAKVYETAQSVGTVTLGPIAEIQQDSVRLKYAGGSVAQSASTSTMLVAAAESVFRAHRLMATGDWN